ncbi:MAG: hypothetical protein JNN15_09670 [Blastocatellia bacterium]|nr:hypothetical protein [Blastocatellia bacterium]
MLRTSSLLTILFLSTTCFTIPTKADTHPEQSVEKVVEFVSIKDEPVKIVSISSTTAKIENRKSFIADETWMDGLSVRVKNISDQAVVGISLFLCGTTSDGERFATYLKYGAVEDEYGFDETNSLPSSEPEVEPSSEVELELDKRHYEAFLKTKKALSKQEVVNFKIQLSLVQLKDGRYWKAGVYFRAPGEEAF